MALRNITKSWSTALWHMLEPRSILLGVVAGLRQMLERLGTITNMPSDAPPVGYGGGICTITTKLSDITALRGVLASNEVLSAIAGEDVLDFKFKAAKLPVGILIFAKSAATIDKCLIRGVDFIEATSGVYLFKVDPTIYGICSADRGGTCTWVCSIGVGLSVDGQDRLCVYRKSASYRTNLQLEHASYYSEAVNGMGTDPNILSTGADIHDYVADPPIKSWAEGSDSYILTTSGRCIKLSGATKSEVYSNTLLYTANGIYHSIDVDTNEVIDWGIDSGSFEVATNVPLTAVQDSADAVRSILSCAGFSTFDTSSHRDKASATYLNGLISKVSNAYNIQKIDIKLANVPPSAVLCVYYAAPGYSLDVNMLTKSTLAGCIACADADYGAWIVESMDYMTSGSARWYTANGKTVGKRPECGDTIVAVTVGTRSPDAGKDDILEHVVIDNEFIHPGSCLIITATAK